MGGRSGVYYRRHGKYIRKIPLLAPPPAPAEEPEGPKTAPEEKPKGMTLEEYLGPKGKPMNSVEAAKGANPHFEESVKARDRKYTHNCQRCVWATELRRRGYNVEALARTSDDSYAKFDASEPKSFVNVASTPITFERFGSFWHDAKASDIKAAMLRHGEGSRGMLVMHGLRSGHVCNWEVKNGKAIIYDGQSNRVHSITKLKKTFQTFNVGRIDDKEVTDLVRDFVKRSGT